MLFCLSNRNYVVCIAASGMHHKHHNTVPQAQRLQPQFAVGITRILAGDGEALKHCLASQKVKTVVLEVGLAFDFIVSDLGQIVDAYSLPAPSSLSDLLVMSPIRYYNNSYFDKRLILRMSNSKFSWPISSLLTAKLPT